MLEKDQGAQLSGIYQRLGDLFLQAEKEFPEIREEEMSFLAVEFNPGHVRLARFMNRVDTDGPRYHVYIGRRITSGISMFRKVKIEDYGLVVDRIADSVNIKLVRTNRLNLILLEQLRPSGRMNRYVDLPSGEILEGGEPVLQGFVDGIAGSHPVGFSIDTINFGQVDFSLH